jgi:hypothetical protein
MYLVAQFAVQHAGKVIATSNTPSYGTKGRNTFFFSISAESLQGSTFDLDESRLGGKVNGQEVGLPTIAGSTDYHFKLSDFARQDLLTSKSKD